MSDPMRPSASLLVKLGSALVHAEEYDSAEGVHLDKVAFDTLLNDPEVQAWLKAMKKLALLPVKR